MEQEPPWMTDGSVVREASSAPVYLIFGGAKFWIPSPAELFALGFTWSDVQVLPDGSLASVGVFPRVGTLLRERDQPQVWCAVDEARLLWVPTPDAMATMGLSWGSVGIIPAGTVAAYPTISLPSASPTPSSMVYDAARSIQGSPPLGKWFPRSEVPGVTLPNGNRVVEIRGWLYSIDSGANGTDPDWGLGLEPDPRSLDSLGVDWTSFIKIGDLLNGPYPKQLTSADDIRAWAGIPHVQMEVCGFPPSNFPWVTLLPTDWKVTGIGGVSGVTWPYMPIDVDGVATNAQFQPGDYVCVSGSIVTDEPHLHSQGGTYYQAASEWSTGLSGQSIDAFDGANPARYTEIHPPDLIGALPDPGRSECLYAIAVVAKSGSLDPGGTDRSITVALPAIPPLPPALFPPPSPGQRVAVREIVGIETHLATITEGNADLTGALVVPDSASVTVHVAVHGQAWSGMPGMFKAIYRVSWQDNPALVTLVDESGDPLVVFTGGLHDWSTPVFAAAPDVGRVITSLTLAVATGDDNLRGGTSIGDNCDATLVTRSGQTLTFPDINQGATWNNGETHAVALPTPPGLAAGDITGLALHTDFGGGLSGDNWDVNEVILLATLADPVTPNRTIIDFGQVSLGHTGPAQRVVLTNTGLRPVSINPMSFTGANWRDFGLAYNACAGRTLDPGQNCVVDISFSPHAVGIRDATLTFADSVTNNPQHLALTGRGI